jgi:hypothetical protein
MIPVKIIHLFTHVDHHHNADNEDDGEKISAYKFANDIGIYRFRFQVIQKPAAPFFPIKSGNFRHSFLPVDETKKSKQVHV